MNDELKAQLDALEKLVVTDEYADETQQFYEQEFSLPTNPFPPSGIADASGDSPPLQHDVASRIIRFITQSYATKQRYFMVLRGDYGTGKTHTLHFIEYIVNSVMNKGDRAARAIYVERPRVEAQELNRTILHSLGYDTVRKYTWFAIHNIIVQDIGVEPSRFTDLKNKLISARIKGKKRSNIPQRGLFPDDQLVSMTPFYDVFNRETLLDYRTFLVALENAGWSREDVRYYFVNVLLEAIGDGQQTDLAQAFIALLLSTDEASFGTWENLVGITRSKALSGLRAPKFLQFLLRIMNLNGIAYVYLLLDEFEEVSQGHLLTPRQQQDYLYTLREVLNSVQQGLSVVIATSPGGWDATLSLSTPLADVSDNLIDLGRVNVDDVMRLIEYYYDRTRRGTKFENIHEYEPFNRQLVERIFQKFPISIQPTPRNLIQCLHNFLDYAARVKTTDFDDEQLEQVLTNFASSKSTHEIQSRGRRSVKGANRTAN